MTRKFFELDSLLWSYRNPNYPNSVRGGSIRLGRVRAHWRRNGKLCDNELDGTAYGVQSWRHWTIAKFITFAHFGRIATHLSIGRLTLTVLAD